MRFKGLDLNLLMALDALLDEKSVSRAAVRLNLSQPAMSAALGRIRVYFNDPILNLHGKRMVPTSHALRIHEELKAILGSVDALISKSTLFDPKTSTRTFIITASDFLAHIVFAPLLKEMRSVAPNVCVEIRAPADSTHELLAQGQIDLVLLPEQIINKAFPHELLFEERFVIVGCQSNPLFAKKINESDFYASGHVVVKLGRLRPQSVSDQGLEARSIARDTDILVSSFLLAPEMVVGTDRLTVMHERLARVFAKRIPIAVAPMPFEFPTLKEHIQYHWTRADDAGLRWMIDKIKAITINYMDASASKQ